MIDLPYIYLASASPRRHQLVRQMGASFTVIPPDIDETPLPMESAADMVRRLSLDKARSVRDRLQHKEDVEPHAVVLGSDTVVVIDGEVLGKPVDPQNAIGMLGRLSGCTHTVFTGYALLGARDGQCHVGHEETQVTFRALSDNEIAHYVASGSPLDKAGSYGIQDDFGAVFIERISGDYYTVMGLPLSKVYVLLRGMLPAIS